MTVLREDMLKGEFSSILNPPKERSEDWQECFSMKGGLIIRLDVCGLILRIF